MQHLAGCLGAPRVLAICWLAVALAAPPASASGFVFEKAMLEGDVAPGTEAGTVFGPLNGLCFTPFPTIDEEGRVAFAAALEGPAITAANRTGIWSGDHSSLTLIARAGTPAPGVAPGGVFASFPVDFALTPPEGGEGRLGFTAVLGGAGMSSAQDEGLWVDAPGGASLLAREGAAAPGPAGVVFSSPLFIDVNRAGHALVTASVSGTGVGTTNNVGFWTDRSGTLAPLLREGDPAPGGAPGVVIGGAGQFIGTGYTFLSITWSEDSRLAVVTSLTGSGVTTFNNEVLFVEQATGGTILVREGDQAPGFNNGLTFGGGSVLADFGMVTVNQLGQTAFTARVAGGGVPLTYPLFSDHTGALAPLVRSGDPAPGTSQQFGFFASPVLSDGGRIAFRATLSGAGSWPPLGLWWDQPGAAGEIVPVVIPGDPTPGRAGSTILGVDFIDGFTAAGLLAFRGTIQDAQGSRAALLLAGPEEADLQVVVATGDLVNAPGHPGDGSDLREVTAIAFGGMNEAGQMALRLDFADGTFGFYSVSGSATSVGDVIPDAAIRLARSVPNPFASSTRLEFDLVAPARVGVSVFDVTGRLVSRLLDEPRPGGRQSVTWDGRDRSGAPVSSGIYWARIETGATSHAVRMVLVRE
jgi:hypothetical protein